MTEMKVLLVENVHPTATEGFKSVGFVVDSLKDFLSEGDLI